MLEAQQFEDSDFEWQTVRLADISQTIRGAEVKGGIALLDEAGDCTCPNEGAPDDVWTHVVVIGNEEGMLCRAVDGIWFPNTDVQSAECHTVNNQLDPPVSVDSQSSHSVVTEADTGTKNSTTTGDGVDDVVDAVQNWLSGGTFPRRTYFSRLAQETSAIKAELRSVFPGPVNRG